MLAKAHVSGAGLAKAKRLGEEMISDPAIWPQITNVLQYQGYRRFRLAHRAFWEQTARFEQYYQERLFQLADQDPAARRLHHEDSATNWDVWYNMVVHPLKHAMWVTWEQHVKLEARYFDAVLVSGKSSLHEMSAMIRDDTSDPDATADPVLDPAVLSPKPSWLRYLGIGRQSA